MAKGGSIKPTKAGTYRARIRISGRMHGKTLPTKKLAEQWLKSMRAKKTLDEARPAELRHGLRERMTYGQIASELRAWWKSGTKRVFTPKTLAGYERTLGWMLADWADQVISETTPRKVDAYIDRLRGEGLSSSSIRHRLDRLSQCIRLAVRNGYLLTPPCQVERPGLVVNSAPPVTSEEDLEALIAEAGRMKDRRPLLVVLLAADAGLRRSEIFRLRAKDVALEQFGDAPGSIHIASESEHFRTKNRKGRTVPILTSRLLDALRACARFLDADSQIVPSTGDDSITWQAKRAWTKAGLGSPQLHACRRRFASKLANAGVPVVRIQAWMGHSSVRTTERYIRINETPTASAIAALEPQEPRHERDHEEHLG